MRRLINYFIKPKSKDKDRARREYILNILLLSSIVLSFVALLASWERALLLYRAITFEALQITVVFAFFLFLYFISRKGGAYVVSIAIVGFYLFITASVSFRWGAEVPAALLSYALIIVMCGILISSRFSFFVTAFIGCMIPLLIYLQDKNLLQVNHYWKKDSETVASGIVFSTILVVIAIVSWLFNKEGEKALKRARDSEAALKKQNDELETIVEERTKELKQMQVEKLVQMYRFAEFGRISSGLFHDLVNHLSLISLNLDKLTETTKSLNQREIKQLIDRTTMGTKRLENFVFTAKKQMQNQEVLQLISLKNEIKEVMQMLDYKAKKAHVQMIFKDGKDIEVFGNPIKFSQVITNLVVNAIDAYDGVVRQDKRVELHLRQSRNNVIFTVQDWGSGINEKFLPKIFDALFTTKTFEKGMGLGLAVCKDIIEKDFKGKISVESREGEGTIFTVNFTIQKTPTGKIKPQLSSK